MSATLQLTKTVPQAWGAKQNLVIPEPQFLPEGIQPISSADVAIGPSLRAYSVQMPSANLSVVRSKEVFEEINAGIGMFTTLEIKKHTARAKLDRNLMSPPIYYVTLDRIDANGKTLRFVEPITANVAYQDRVYFCQNEDLGIVSMSAKLEDCIKDFKDEILFVWNEYGKEDDSRLTNDAKELKRRILQYIGK